MDGKKVILRPQRLFSEDVKRDLVSEYERGKLTVGEISRLYSISKSLIYRWIYQYSTYNKKKIIVVEQRQSSRQKLGDLEQRIKDLERIVGQKQLKIDFLEQMIDLAEHEYQISIKKNSATPPFDGSKNKAERKAVR